MSTLEEGFEGLVELIQAEDYESAFVLASALAEQGHARSQFILGMMYRQELGVAKDWDKSIYWYQLAAAQGDNDAKEELDSYRKLRAQMNEKNRKTGDPPIKFLDRLDRPPNIPQRPSSSSSSAASTGSSSLSNKSKITYDDGSVYEGDLINGNPHGKGKITFADGNMYEGDWVNGKRHGKGKSAFTNGDKYEGDYANDQRNGKGKYTFKNGNIGEGDYVNGKLHGSEKTTFPDGRIQYAIWDNGTFIRWENTPQNPSTLQKSSGSSNTSFGPDELDTAIREASDQIINGVAAGTKIGIINIQSSSAALSDYIIDELTANAVKDRIFTVLDRQEIDLIRKEMNFQNSGNVDDKTALQIGRMTGIQTIITGTVSSLGDKYRLSIIALNVQTGNMQVMFNRNIAAGKKITSLM